VVTAYNNKVYKVTGIDFDKVPTESFLLQDGTAVTYLEYYSRKHGV